MVHVVEKSSRAEVNILKFFISVKPKSVKMRVESNKKLVVFQ